MARALNMQIPISWWTILPITVSAVAAAISLENASYSDPELPSELGGHPERYEVDVQDTNTKLYIDTTLRMDPVDFDGLIREAIIDLHTQSDKSAPIPPTGYQTSYPKGNPRVTFIFSRFKNRKAVWHLIQDTITGLLNWAVNGKPGHPWSMNIRVLYQCSQMATADILELGPLANVTVN